MRRLENKVALVTGGSSGIGLAVARRLAAEGAHVIAVSRRPLPEESDAMTCMQCDVSDPAAVQSVIQQCGDRFGRLDIVCNNAGVGMREVQRIHQISIDEWDRVLATNLRGAFNVLKYTLELMLTAARGSIINMASISSFKATPGSGAYIASKGGLMMLTRAAALEYAADGIRVNAVCPGVTRTPILDDAPPALIEMLTRAVPLGRMATPEDIAALTAFLASDEAAHITGAAYVVDGGTLAA